VTEDYPHPFAKGAVVADSEVSSKKMVAGILGILLGGLGVHRFYLGDTTGGLIRIAVTVITCGFGSIIGLIEGIIYLTKSDSDFQKLYLEEKKAWF
jgi:TM2 domain-containing membrane protein YozV